MPDGKPSTLVAVALIVIGLLILVPSGLCTTLGLLLSLPTGGADAVGIVLGVGGPFIAVGGLLFWLGRRMKVARESTDAQAKDFSPPPA